MPADRSRLPEWSVQENSENLSFLEAGPTSFWMFGREWVLDGWPRENSGLKRNISQNRAYICNGPYRSEVQKKDFPLKCRKNVQKMFLAIWGLPPKKCQKNVPECLLGLPGSLPEKCPKNVWKMSWCWGWRWKNVQKMLKKCPPDIFQILF